MTMESSGKTKSDPGMSKAIESTNALIEDVQQFRTKLIATIEEIPAEKANIYHRFAGSKQLQTSERIAQPDSQSKRCWLKSKRIQSICAKHKTVSLIVLQTPSSIRSFILSCMFWNQLAFQAEANKQALLNYEFAKADLWARILRK